jgi:hypothetical protein
MDTRAAFAFGAGLGLGIGLVTLFRRRRVGSDETHPLS